MIEFIISYIIGSINFCWIIGKIKNIDISKEGDENLGSMNLYYSLKKYSKAKSLIFATIGGFLDALKAYIPTILFGPLAGAFAVLGHCFSIFSIIITRKIPSGVGVASSIGWLLGLGFSYVLEILSIAIPLLIIGIISFYDIIEIENLNIYTIFLMLSTSLLYIILYNPIETVKISLVIVAHITAFSAALRSKVIFKKYIKK